MLSDRKVLVTGATGQVARPIAESLAKDNEVWCIARFTNPQARAELEAQGIHCAFWELGSADFGDLPDDFTHVVHSAADIFNADYDDAIRTNAEGTGLLMTHCRKADRFLFVSGSTVYKTNDDPRHAYLETDALGGHAAYAPTYPVSKLAAEVVVRTAARQLQLPSTIARLNICYGNAGHGGLPSVFVGWMLEGKPLPKRIGRANFGSPIHEDDIVAQIEPLFDAASVPATIVNWGGDEPVEDLEMYRYLAELTGLEARVEETDAFYFDMYVLDPAKRISITGPSKVTWRDAVRRSIAHRFPDLNFKPL